MQFILLYIHVYTCTCIALYKRGLRINIFLEFPLLKKKQRSLLQISQLCSYIHFLIRVRIKHCQKKIFNLIEKKFAIKFCKVRLLKSRLTYTRHDYIIAFSFLFCPQTTCIKLKLILMGIFFFCHLFLHAANSSLQQKKRERKKKVMIYIVQLIY